MKNYLHRIMICLDRSEADQAILHFIKQLAQVISIDQLYFLHIQPSLELPSDVKKKYAKLFAPVDEGLQQVLADAVEAALGAEAPEWEVIVREGDSVKDIVKMANLKQVDALVFGKKPADEASGMIPSKVASRSPFSIFMVPSDLADTYRLQKVMVATDFSEYAGMAMEQALALTAQSKGEVYCHHVYEVPIGYYKTGKSQEEFASIMKAHAEKSMDKFLKPFNGQLDRVVPIFSFRNKGEVSRLFWKEADKRHADMVVIGSKGRTGASAIVMGSVADRTINQSLNKPVLVIKKVGENMNFIEALLRV